MEGLFAMMFSLSKVQNAGHATELEDINIQNGITAQRVIIMKIVMFVTMAGTKGQHGIFLQE